TNIASHPDEWLATPVRADTGVEDARGCGDPDSRRRVQNILPKELDLHHKSSVTSVLHERNNYLGPSRARPPPEGQNLAAVSRFAAGVSPAGVRARSGTILQRAIGIAGGGWTKR